MKLCIDCHEQPQIARKRCRSCYRTAATRGTIQISTRTGATQCSVPGCTAAGLLRHGLCEMHYTRQRRYGSTDGRAALLEVVAAARDYFEAVDRCDGIVAAEQALRAAVEECGR